MKWLIYKNRS